MTLDDHATLCDTVALAALDRDSQSAVARLVEALLFGGGDEEAVALYLAARRLGRSHEEARGAVNRAWHFGVGHPPLPNEMTEEDVREYVLPQVVGMVCHGYDRGVMGDWSLMAAAWWPEGGAM